MLPKKEIKNGLDDILKAVTETHRRGYNQPPTGYNQVSQPQPQGGELQCGRRTLYSELRATCCTNFS